MEFGEFGTRGDDVWDDSKTGGGAANKQTNKQTRKCGTNFPRTPRLVSTFHNFIVFATDALPRLDASYKQSAQIPPVRLFPASLIIGHILQVMMGAT